MTFFNLEKIAVGGSYIMPDSLQQSAASALSSVRAKYPSGSKITTKERRLHC